MTLRTLIASKLKEKDWTVAHLARLSGCKLQSLHKMLKGERIINGRALMAFDAVLALNVDFGDCTVGRVTERDHAREAK